MKIFIGTDHAGYNVKETLKVHLTDQGHEVVDKGAFTLDPNDDYPDFVRPVAEEVGKGSGTKTEEVRGIIIGGSGSGEAMCANRVKGARALVFYGPVAPKGAVDVSGRESADPYELVKLARLHNNANILSLGMRFLTDDQILEAVRVFLNTPFSGDERHIRRIEKLDK